MKIVNLKAQNFKILKAIEITPEGNVVKISGENGAGKTSVLDVLWAALCGGDAKKEIKQPIRKGSKQATITLDLGELIVTRKWTGKDKSYLTVENKKGASFKSPQAMLDHMIGKLTFDPLEFAGLNAKAQREALLKVVTLDIDPEEIDAQRRGIYETRTEHNREITRFEGVLASLEKPSKAVPKEEISISDVVAEIGAARAQQSEKNTLRTKAEANKQNCVVLEDRITELKQKLNKAELDLESEQDWLEANKDAHNAITVPDIDALQAKLDKAEATNVSVREAQHYEITLLEISEETKKADKCSDQIKALDKQKADAIKAAKMPVKGLSFDEDGLVFNDVPFSQASSAEKLKVSVAMAMALNPELRVLRITDGSLLDSKSMALIEKMAVDHDYQVWVEIVDDTGEVGICIEDGMIAGENEKDPSSGITSR